MARTILVTGSAAGIGRATRERLIAQGDRVIGADLRDADIEADLATDAGRDALARAVTDLARDGLDGVVASAGLVDDTPRTIAVNYFGTIGVLERLRPLLARSPAPRAVVLCSIASFMPADDAAVAQCLAGDEAAAMAAAAASTGSAYVISKRALALWVRRTAVTAEWAGARILLNGVGPGVTRTAMTAPMLATPAGAAALRELTPVATGRYAEAAEPAELVAYMASFGGGYLLGQIIYCDGGSDALLRPEHI